MTMIAVSKVTKEFNLGAFRGLKTSLADWKTRLSGQTPPPRPKFKALHDIDFTIEEGEVVGLIGHNGAGKSTLLKLLSRITTPTSGSIRVNGKIAPLIEVGAGLVGDLTGRENIFLNAAILGMPRTEVHKKLDGIISFAELEEFIDTPVKRYSSGMQVRLGFSIATAIEAEILIIDEVLAVGDLAFQRKCMSRIESLIAATGRTVLIVNHNVRQLERICNRIILLDKGSIAFDGDPSQGCNIFYEANNKKFQAYTEQEHHAKQRIESSGEIEVIGISIEDPTTRQPIEAVEMGNGMHVSIKFHSNVEIANAELVLGIHTTDFVYVSSFGTGTLTKKPRINIGENIVHCTIPELTLYPGVYLLRLSFLDKFSRAMWYGESLKAFRVEVTQKSRAELPNLGLVALPYEWRY